MNFTYNLKDRPVKSKPQEYERFLKGLEQELRKNFHETLTDPIMHEYLVEFANSGARLLIKRILGEEPNE